MNELDFGRCPKCGYDSVSVQWRGSGSHMNCANYHAGKGEHFHCRCVRCEYPWAMKVNDVGQLKNLRDFV